MKYTENYNLKKPEAEDFYNVEDFNENMEVIDGELKNLEDNKVDKIPGKGLSTNDYTTEEKNKLAGIEAGANKYVHPSTHSADMIVENTNKRFVSDTEKATWNATKTEIEAAKKHSLIYLGESLEYGGNILVLTQDENFIYVGGGTTNKVFKLNKTDLSKVAESLEYGGNIHALTQDENFIYVGGGTTNKVFKLLNLVSLKN